MELFFVGLCFIECLWLCDFDVVIKKWGMFIVGEFYYNESIFFSMIFVVFLRKGRVILFFLKYVFFSIFWLSKVRKIV